MDNGKPIVPVDFFLIGAAKSGTTWLSQCLGEHPEIAIAEGKEPNFFVDRAGIWGSARNRYFMSDWKDYSHVFRHAKPGQIRGDCSVNLFHNLNAPLIIARHYPDAKLLVILRNPMDRTYSHYWHERLFERCPGVPESFEEAISNPDLILRSRYFVQLSAWLACFHPSQVHVTLDLDLRSDSLAAISEVYRFLGVSTSFVPAAIGQRINASLTRSRMLIALETVDRKIRHGPLARLPGMLGELGVGRLVWKLTTRPNPYPPMNSDTRERLKEMLRPDIEQLRKLIGRDLGGWLA